MANDKANVRRGDFVRGGFHPASLKRADDKLRREFPEFADTITNAGLRPSPARLRELAEEREALAQRMADIKARIAALRRRK